MFITKWEGLILLMQNSYNKDKSILILHFIVEGFFPLNLGKNVLFKILWK